MRGWILTIIALTGLQIAPPFALVEGRWVRQGFVQTAKPAEADFRIDFVCKQLSQPFYQQTFYFKQDWQYLAEGQWPIGHGWGSSTRGCGPSGSLSVILSAAARDDGVKIDFSAKRTSSVANVSPVEVKQRLEISWRAFPYSYESGDFSYQATFSLEQGNWAALELEACHTIWCIFSGDSLFRKSRNKIIPQEEPMAHYGTHPRLSRETPPSSDEAWHWFVCNGPNGEKFQWCDPVLGSGSELSLLRKFIAERSAAIPDFEAHARAIAVESLRDEDFRLVLKGIHVLTAIGTDEEMLLLKPLTEAQNGEVAKHARTALFERRVKFKKVG